MFKSIKTIVETISVGNMFSCNSYMYNMGNNFSFKVSFLKGLL